VGFKPKKFDLVHQPVFLFLVRSVVWARDYTFPGLACLHQDTQSHLSPAGELVNKHSLVASTLEVRNGQILLTIVTDGIYFNEFLKCLTSIQEAKMEDMEVDKITVTMNLTSFHPSQDWVSSSWFFTSCNQRPEQIDQQGS